MLGLIPSLGWQEMFLLLVITVLLFHAEMAEAARAMVTDVSRWLSQFTQPW